MHALLIKYVLVMSLYSAFLFLWIQRSPMFLEGMLKMSVKH